MHEEKLLGKPLETYFEKREFPPEKSKLFKLLNTKITVLTRNL